MKKIFHRPEFEDSSGKRVVAWIITSYALSFVVGASVAKMMRKVFYSN